MSNAIAKRYDGMREFVLETTYGYYSEYGWGFASDFDSLEVAKGKCDFWNKTGGSYRVVSDGRVVYDRK